jgi:Rps23 Pro-64 3,4-dihydroxylase Tpa1-like proline 4-hydroxylase
MINKDILNSADNLKSSFRQAYPFPHIIIDNFFDPFILDQSLSEIQKYDDWAFDPNNYAAGNQVNKFYAPYSGNDDELARIQNVAPYTKSVLDYLQTNEFIHFLERLSGIKNLLGDEKLMACSVHKVTKGGKLLVHADHNTHYITGLHRRLNILLYLNKNWEDDWNGHLELWNKDLTTQTHKIAPIFNRVVIFEVTDDAFHGHPIPLETPDGVYRLSFAGYYCTTERPEYEITPRHDVLWKNVSTV